MLSNTEIIKRRAEGKIIITDFNPDNLTSSAYDVRLGSTIITQNDKSKRVENPWSTSYNYWGEPRDAYIAEDEDVVKFDLKLDQPFFIIEPGELVLAHTEEFIGTTAESNVTTMMKARSSLGRVGITVCSCAGLGDCGFFNRWAMEIRNNSGSTLILPVGMRVAQILFFELVGESTIDYAKAGHYQDKSQSLDEMIATWSPKQLYPRLWLDREIFDQRSNP